MAKINEKHHSRRFKDEDDREIEFQGVHLIETGLAALFTTVLPIADDYKHRKIRICLNEQEAEHLRDSLTRMLNARRHTVEMRLLDKSSVTSNK